MADVLIVCVREDENLAKAFADMFERAGLQVGGAPGAPEDMHHCGAALVVWSQASIRSRAFLDAAQRAVYAGKAVVACLIAPPPPASINHAPAFDLSGWTGDPNDEVLDPLFFCVDRKVATARAAAGVTAGLAAREAPPPAYTPQAAPPYTRARGTSPPSAAPLARAAPDRNPASPAARSGALPKLDVFISYPRAARAKVERIKESLRKRGLNVFFDVDGIDGGAEFPVVIDKAVKSAAVVLGCWSSLAFTRPWVMQECRVGKARDVLVPVAIERFDDLEVPTEFFGLNYLDLSDWTGSEGHESWKRTLAALARHGVRIG